MEQECVRQECIDFLEFLKAEGISVEEVKRNITIIRIANGKEFELSVDYSRGIADLLKESSLDSFCSEAQNKKLNYPQWKKEELKKPCEDKVIVISDGSEYVSEESENFDTLLEEKIEFLAVLYPCSNSPRETAKEIKAKGLIPAGLHGILALEKEYPDLQRYLSVVSVGTHLCEGDEDPITFMLAFYEQERKLVPVYFDIAEGRRRYALAFKKKA